VAPPTSAHTRVYESADVIDETVWVLRTTEPSLTASTSTPYVAHSTVLPRTALSATQSKGTAPAAHPTPQMQSQYCHPPSAPVTDCATSSTFSLHPCSFTHTYSNVPTSTAAQSYLNVPLRSTATITTSAASHPHV